MPEQAYGMRRLPPWSKQMNKSTVAVVSTLLLLFVAGCTAQKDDRAVLVTVNDSAIYTNDLNRNIALNLKRDPSQPLSEDIIQRQIDILIDKKLLIEEAKKRKLDETQKFSDTIKTFWEQTLIRDLIEKVDKEIEEDVDVTDAEITEYYGKIGYKKTFDIIRTEDKDYAEKLEFKSPEQIDWEMQIGPVSYDEIESPLVLFAFESMNKGDMKIAKDRDTYYIIYVSEQEPVENPPLTAVKDDIVQKIKQGKKRDSFSKWIIEKRKNADVEINQEAVQEIIQR